MLRTGLVVALLASIGSAQDAPDFVKEVAPILQHRCVSCHGPDKQKGDLRLDRKQHLFVEGDEDFWSVVPGKPDDSLLIERVELPVGHEELMPNEGEPLRPEQIALLRRWIAAGAAWPAEGDHYFRAVAEARKVKRLDFGIPALPAARQAAVDAAIATLAERGILAGRVAQDTPAVDVNASLLGSKFTDEHLVLLEKLAPVLVWLNLSRTAVTDAGLRRLQNFSQLRRLNVSRTAIGDRGIAVLGGLERLEVLNVYGTKVTDAALPSMASLAALQKVYAFETAITGPGVAAMPLRAPKLVIDRGEYVTERLADAGAKTAGADRDRAPVNKVCPVANRPADAAQTVDHDGLLIAFCCAKCKQTFAADPTKFADKIADFRKLASEQKKSQ